MGKIGTACVTMLLAGLVAGPMAHGYVATMGEVTAFSMGPGICGPTVCPPPMCPPAYCAPPTCPPPMPCPPPLYYKPITKVKKGRVAPAPMVPMAAPVCGPTGCYAPRWH